MADKKTEFTQACHNRNMNSNFCIY